MIGTGFTSGQVDHCRRYDPHGKFQAFPAGVVNRDGTVNSADTSAIMFAISYQADLDVNMDGSVDTKDSSLVSKLRGRSLADGQLSDSGNIVGWCGYLYEEATGMWLAQHYRHRAIPKTTAGPDRTGPVERLKVTPRGFEPRLPG